MKRAYVAGLAACALLIGSPALGQNTINIGLSGALTGPASGTFAPAVEGLRLYVERLNKNGGIDGKTINLILQDDEGQPSRAVANVKRLLGQKVALLINSSLSSTQAPTIQEAQRAGVPLLFAGSVCPKETNPPAVEGVFCTNAFAAQYDSRAALDFIKAKATAPVKLGLAGMAIPVSRSEIDYAEILAKEVGMQPVAKEIVPPATPDYTPFATKIMQAEPNWVYVWAPWVAEVRTLEALRKLGWQNDYVTFANPEAEIDMERLTDGRFFTTAVNAFFSDKLPVHQEIIDTAKAFNSSFNPNLLAEGWITGLTIEAAIKAAGGAPEKIGAAMNNLNVDTKGLRGGPIEWTKENHFRAKQYYRVYRWSPDKKAIEMVQDWKAYDVK